MKNNNKALKSRVVNVIEQLFERSDNQLIPDVEEICSKAKTNRKTALKYLYQWWDQQAANCSGVDWLSTLSEEEFDGCNLLQSVFTSVECLIKEIENSYEAFNFSSENSYPLTNHIVQPLLEIKDKILQVINLNENTKEHLKELEKTVCDKQDECERLKRELDAMQSAYSKKLSLMREELDASRRETTAAKLLVKSLKREKRGSIYKPVFQYKFDS
ncbi:MAG: hypothetical protein H0U70_12765 [Tatlockia sp.]|nr:hypothetical protein [Tatlockia sp.]